MTNQFDIATIVADYVKGLNKEALDKQPTSVKFSKYVFQFNETYPSGKAAPLLFSDFSRVTHALLESAFIKGEDAAESRKRFKIDILDIPRITRYVEFVGFLQTLPGANVTPTLSPDDISKMLTKLTFAVEETLEMAIIEKRPIKYEVLKEDFKAYVSGRMFNIDDSIRNFNIFPYFTKDAEIFAFGLEVFIDFYATLILPSEDKLGERENSYDRVLLMANDLLKGA